MDDVKTNNKDGSPSFLITIDTEGDNLWSRPRNITSRNADFLPRFQETCEEYGFRPTYLTNYEMAESRAFRQFAADVLKRNAGEIGTHLHAWNSPPLTPLTRDDFRYHPYLIEYPPEVMREKVTVVTELLEDTFGVKVVSHRAGRWSFNETYARILLEKGYRVDCSVTPHVSWRRTLGDPNQKGGTDYSRFPEDAYFLDLADISRPGDSPLLEVPVTIIANRRPWIDWTRRPSGRIPLARGALRRLFPSVHWLRPNGRNRRSLLRILRLAIRDRRRYVAFMLHSSELMPGGSPTFPRDADIERLYDDLKVLFHEASQVFTGATLKEYRERAVGLVNAG